MKRFIKTVRLSLASLLTVSTIVTVNANALPKRMVDLRIQNIFLTQDCRVAIRIQNVGNRRIPPFFWGRNVLRVTPKITIKKDYQVVKNIDLVDIPNSRNLIFPNGSVVYKTDIRVQNQARIKALIDSTNILIERSEANNKMQKILRCNQCGMNRKPDLVIKSFGLQRWGQCSPNRAVILFKVRVKNIGNAPTPYIPTKALIQVVDEDGSQWGNGAIMPRVFPGQTRSVIVPIYYLKSDPNHLKQNRPHRFRAIVDPLNLVDESNEVNNKSRILKIKTSSFCQ